MDGRKTSKREKGKGTVRRAEMNKQIWNKLIWDIFEYKNECSITLRVWAIAI